MNKRLEIIILILLSITCAWLIYDAGVFPIRPLPTIPGWHITIYPPYFVAKCLGAFILFIIVIWRSLFLYFDKD